MEPMPSIKLHSDASRGKVASRLELGLAFVVAGALTLFLANRIPTVFLHPLANDVWYESDMARVFENMTQRDGGHVWAAKHPIFALLIWPAVSFFKALGADAILAVRLTLALNAGACAALLVKVLRLDGLERPERWAVLAIFLTSAAFWLWFPISDSFAFGATTIVLALYPLALDQSGKVAGRAQWILSTTLALAVTITNVAAAMVALAVRILMPGDFGLFHGRFWSKVLVAMGIGAAAVGIVLAGAIVQDRLFAGAGYFLNINALAKEKQFVGMYHNSSLNNRLHALIIQPVTSSQPIPVGPARLTDDGQLTTSLFVDGATPKTLVGQVARYSWFALLAIGVLACARPKTTSPLVIAAGLLLLVNIGLHLVYGEEAFLYVAHLLPLALIVAARSRRLLPRPAFLALAAIIAGTSLTTSYAMFKESTLVGARLAEEAVALKTAFKAKQAAIAPSVTSPDL